VLLGFRGGLGWRVSFCSGGGGGVNSGKGLGRYVCNSHVMDEPVCFVFWRRQMLVLPRALVFFSSGHS